MTGTTQFGACFAFTPLKMYMRFLSLLLLSIIIQQKGFAQQNSNSILYWNKDKSLAGLITWLLLTTNRMLLHLQPHS
jgi:branched-subunit amino acid transport protein